MKIKEDNYLSLVENSFRDRASPEESVPMAKYMRDKFPFLGIKSPLRNEISRELLKKSRRPQYSELDVIIPKLWELPEREFQYFGIALVEKYQKEFTPEIISLLEFMVVKKSWWDTVDTVASKLIGSYFCLFPGGKYSIAEKWLTSENIWLQRSVLLFQLKYKMETDWELLSVSINRLKDSREFFIQKAIGWALREYSKVEPEKVEKFILKSNLSPLSEREGFKVLRKKTDVQKN